MELKLRLLRGVRRSHVIQPHRRMLAQYYRSRIPFIYSLSRHQTRCFDSGRRYGISRKVPLSRFTFRTITNVGEWPGFRRASW